MAGIPLNPESDLCLLTVVISTSEVRRVIVIPWKKCAILWLAQKCKPGCSFTSFWYMMIHSFWKEVLPQSIQYVNENVSTITERWVEKGSLALFVHYYQTAFTSETNPSGLVWVGTSPLWNILSLQTSETTPDDFPYVYTNAGFCWRCAPVSR